MSSLRIFCLLVLVVSACKDKAGDVPDQSAPPADVPLIGKEDLPGHVTGPDDDETPKSPPSEVPSENPPMEDEKVGAAGRVSEDMLRKLSPDVKTMLRDQAFLDSQEPVILSLKLVEGRVLKSRLQMRSITRSAGRAADLTLGVTWSETYGKEQNGWAPVKWRLSDVAYVMPGVPQEYSTSLQTALSGLTLVYEIDSKGKIQSLERKGNIARQFEPVAEALVQGFEQKTVTLPEKPQTVGSSWSTTSNTDAGGVLLTTKNKYTFKGLIEGPGGHRFAYIEFSSKLTIAPSKQDKSVKTSGTGNGKGVVLIDIDDGYDLVTTLSMDLEQEFKASGDSAQGDRQSISIELVSERLL